MSDATATPEPEDEGLDVPVPEETVEIQKPEPTMTTEEFKEEFLNEGCVPHTDVPRSPAGPVNEEPYYDRDPEWPKVPPEVLEQVSPDGSAPSSVLDDWAVRNKVDNAVRDLGARGLAMLCEKLELANASFPPPPKPCCDDETCEACEDCDADQCSTECCHNWSEEELMKTKAPEEERDLEDIVDHVKDRWKTFRKYAAIVGWIVAGVIGGSAGTTLIDESAKPPLVVEDPVVGEELPDRDSVIASLYFELGKHGHPLEVNDEGDVSFTIHKDSINGNRGYDAKFRQTEGGHLNVTLER